MARRFEQAIASEKYNGQKHQRLDGLNVIQRQKSETRDIKQKCDQRITEQRQRFVPNEKDETNRNKETLLRGPKMRK